MKILIIILTILAFLILIYRFYLSITGKRLARLIESKDRFIWNNLKVIDGPTNIVAGKITLFLDNKHMVISEDSLPSIYRSLKSEGTLPNAIAIPFDNITQFDYSANHEGNVISIFSKIKNIIFLVNSYRLNIEYIDSSNELKNLELSSKGIEEYTFEDAFSDFDHQIYKRRKHAEHEKPKKEKNKNKSDKGSQTKQMNTVTEKAPSKDHTIKIRNEEEVPVKKVHSGDQTSPIQ